MLSTKELISRIKSQDENVRAEAWQNAGNAGADAVRPLARVMATADMEVARAAKRALWKIARHVGRPGATGEKKPAVKQLTQLLGDRQTVAVRREIIWMLSELADGGRPVARLASLLLNEELREDARMALERIPGNKSLEALRKGLKAVAKDFKVNIAQSLRARGQIVPGLPCEKLMPKKGTDVKPVRV